MPVQPLTRAAVQTLAVVEAATHHGRYHGAYREHVVAARAEVQDIASCASESSLRGYTREYLHALREIGLIEHFTGPCGFLFWRTTASGDSRLQEFLKRRPTLRQEYPGIVEIVKRQTLYVVPSEDKPEPC